MKEEIVQFLFLVFSVVLAAALEELLPSCCGAGLPLTLAVVMSVAPRLNVLPGVMSAIGAGAFEDALSALPPLTSVSFFMIAALLSRKEYFPRTSLVVLFPAYALWTGMCAAGPFGDVFLRVAVSLPLGALAFLLVNPMLNFIGGKAGLDD